MFDNRKIEKAFNDVCGHDEKWVLESGDNCYIVLSKESRNKFPIDSINYFDKHDSCITLKCFRKSKLIVAKDGTVQVYVNDYEDALKKMFGVTGATMELSQFVAGADLLYGMMCALSEAHDKDAIDGEKLFWYTNDEMFDNQFRIGIIFYPDERWLARYVSLRPENKDYIDYMERIFALRKADSECGTSYGGELEIVEPATFAMYKDFILAYLDKLEQMFISQTDTAKTVTANIEERAKKLLEARTGNTDGDTETA